MQAALATPLPGLFPVAARELVEHRNYLVRFAQRRLSDPLLAEDAVHDVFEAVISGRAVFAGRAALRSWLTAVLKNKIVDIVRRRPMVECLDDGADDSSGAFAHACPQPGPEECADQRQRHARWCSATWVKSAAKASPFIRKSVTTRMHSISINFLLLARLPAMPVRHLAQPPYILKTWTS